MTPDPGAAAGSGAPAPTWQHLSEWPRVILHRPNLRRTVATALVVGTVLFGINHLGAALGGHASVSTWVATGLSYVVPFFVANLGLLFASRVHPRPAPGERPQAAPRPTWRRLRECPRCMLHGPHLRRTAATALAVGTIYLVINHLGALTGGHASAATWVAAGVTYLVPFSVANTGVLVGCREPSTLG